MEEYRKNSSCCLSEKPQRMTPYSHDRSGSPNLFIGRRLDVRSRIHNPKAVHCRRITEECGCRRTLKAGVENSRQGKSDDVTDMMKGLRFVRGCSSMTTFMENCPRENLNRFGVAGGRGSSQKTANGRQNAMPWRKETHFRLLTGTVEKVAHWYPMKNHLQLLVEVVALLVEKKQGALPTEWCLVLRDGRTGPSLLVVYYEVDRPMPDLTVGGVVRCVGRLTSRGSMQAFKVENTSEEERVDSHRLFFISGLAAEEAKDTFSHKN